MKRIFLLLLFLIVLIPADPAFALSELAGDFLLHARQLDAHFPPEDWSDEDIRSAAIEVLDSYESGESDEWVVYFCLVALGYTEVPEDVERITEYEESMPGTVYHVLRGFPAPEAIECLLRGLVHERASFREDSIKGLGEIDYELLEEPDDWRGVVIENLLDARDVETVEPIMELIDETVADLEAVGSGTSD